MTDQKTDEQQEQKTEQKATPSYFGMGAEELAALVKAFLENKDAAKGLVAMFTPIVSEVIDMVMDTVGPEVYKVIRRSSLANVELRKEIFEAYQKAGFTPEQAFYLLVMDGGSDKFGKAVEAAKSVKLPTK